MHCHGSDNDTLTLSPEAVAEDVRGELLAETVSVPKGGNFVDSYLDVVGPDAVLGDPDRLQTALDDAHTQIPTTTETPVTFVEGNLAVRFFASRRIPNGAQDEFKALGNYLLHLSRRLANAAAPPLVIQRSFENGTYSFRLQNGERESAAARLTIEQDVIEEFERRHGSILPVVPTLLLPSTEDVDVEIVDETGRPLWSTMAGFGL